jgi:hypothetical protein
VKKGRLSNNYGFQRMGHHPFYRRQKVPKLFLRVLLIIGIFITGCANGYQDDDDSAKNQGDNYNTVRVYNMSATETIRSFALYDNNTKKSVKQSGAVNMSQTHPGSNMSNISAGTYFVRIHTFSGNDYNSPSFSLSKGRQQEVWFWGTFVNLDD